MPTIVVKDTLTKGEFEEALRDYETYIKIYVRAEMTAPKFWIRKSAKSFWN